MPRLLGISTALAATIAACVLALGCGGDKQNAVVVRVGDKTITKRSIDHWIHVEAVTSSDPFPTGAAPKGLFPVPPEYKDCISYLLTGPKARKPEPSHAQLKHECAVKYSLLKHQILELLITYYWVSAEAAQKGIHLTSQEVAQYQGREFPTAAERRHFAFATGESPADQRMLAERVLLSLKLQEAIAHSSHITAEQAIPRFASGLAAKWAQQTSCNEGYVVPQCKQYKGPHDI